MPSLTVITGTCGSGKSAVVKQLASKPDTYNIASLDADDYGYVGDRDTGEFADVDMVNLSQEEYDELNVTWWIDLPKLESDALQLHDAGYNVVVGGLGHNINELLALPFWEKKILLTVTDDTLKQRLGNRDNPWGKVEWQRDGCLQVQSQLRGSFQGDVIENSDISIDELADAVLQLIGVEETTEEGDTDEDAGTD